jgi:molybdate transport system substrate-binding protein
VLWSAKPGYVDDQGEVLKKGEFNKLALANPKLAPYGLAAMESITRLGVLNAVQPKFVHRREHRPDLSIRISTGNAELGFVALSQVMKDGRLTGGSAWIVPASLHDAYSPGRGRFSPTARAMPPPRRL